MLPLPSLRPVDGLWLLLALSFLLAYSAHRGVPRLSAAPERLAPYRLLQEFIRFGKSSAPGRRRRWLWPVPKRWFLHFYVVSVLWNGLLLLLSLRTLLLGDPFPGWLDSALWLLDAGDTRTPPQAEAPSVILLQVLLWLHSARRLLECLSVSIFSNSSINVVQYTFGLLYYVLLGLTVLSLGPPRPSADVAVDRLGSWLRWYHGTGLLLFLWASLHQHRCLVLLAQLRTHHGGQAGGQATLEHRVPHGDWFELVSCPHYLAEVLIYMSLGACCGGRALTWWLVVLYVLSNQLLAAQLSHEFYLSRFKSYPAHRTALLPYLL